MKISQLIRKFELDRTSIKERNSLHRSIFGDTQKNEKNNTHKWEQPLEELRKYGYCKLPDSPLRNEYIRALRSASEKQENIYDHMRLLMELFPANNNTAQPKFNSNGKMSWDTTNLIPSLNNCNFMTNLHELLTLYYRRPYWTRNPSKIIIDSKEHRSISHDQSLYHLDWGFHQLSLIILLNTPNLSTRTRVIKRTHKNRHLFYNVPKIGSNNRFSKLNKLKAKALEKLNGTDDLIGNTGTSFLIDAGNALHKAVYGENRSIIHFNFAVNFSYAHEAYAEELKSNSINYLSKYNILDLMN